MEKLFMVLLMLIGCTIPLQADLKFDPINNRFFTVPASNKVNLDEYNALMLQCLVLVQRVIAINGYPTTEKEKEVVFNLWHSHLNKIGTATAKRLISDLKKALKKDILDLQMQ